MKTPILFRWFCITFVVFAITLWTGMYVTENLLPKTYTATAELQVFVRPYPFVGSFPPPAPTVSDEDEIPIQESPDILLPVIRDLGLDKAWAKQMSKSGVEKLSEGEALAYMSKILKLDYMRGTKIIDLTVMSASPQEAADIANAIADRYKAKRDLEEDQRTTRGMDALREQIAEQQKVVERKKIPLDRPQDVQPGTERDFQNQRSLLEALKIKLQQDEADFRLQQSPVRIISRATVPEWPSKPNHPLYFIGTVGIAAVISLVVGCFAEVIMLFCRAGETEQT